MNNFEKIVPNLGTKFGPNLGTKRGSSPEHNQNEVQIDPETILVPKLQPNLIPRLWTLPPNESK